MAVDDLLQIVSKHPRSRRGWVYEPRERCLPTWLSMLRVAWCSEHIAVRLVSLISSLLAHLACKSGRLITMLISYIPPGSTTVPWDDSRPMNRSTAASCCDLHATSRAGIPIGNDERADRIFARKTDVRMSRYCTHAMISLPR